MAIHFSWHQGSLFLVFCFLGFLSFPADAALKKYQFDIQVKNVSRLCHAKPIVTVNGMFPGPTIYVREGDQVLVNVTNYAQYNASIHWHGLKQFRNGWADGPAYITQCPIKTGHSYTYNFQVMGTPFPFPQPYSEANIVLGEWWNSDIETMVNQANKLGLPPPTSDAHTINGKPGPLFPCSEKHTFAMEVESERNTAGVPTGGWTAIRFRADNPGVWFMHCHLELHTMWGPKMAFVVENGKSPEESVLPPPEDLPPC
ncbi:hypothetical protein VitviT2T_005046 [Vitis vinifera]|uniref:Uncharacterized protein n=1 Tax=Vitis vinifera TaxID=29760 RepID=A0ABY9BRD8_VITVI|nr:hypothetical protein VitviT2T_005046 [Vitis vinifera]